MTDSEVSKCLSALPTEVLGSILDNIADQRTMSALGRTSREFYSIVMPRLYRRVAIEDTLLFAGSEEDSHTTVAEPPGLIRMLDPHLANAQKRKLMREGRYGDQTACSAYLYQREL
ncbi:hypothetical protein PG996_015069 [Apiospora saccharicola]|uniref:F-box domain-containing protein n=1 Tax=Apiospora saccharicola TaxID=335842 RepID=A0ABR1TK29_9PEZI